MSELTYATVAALPLAARSAVAALRDAGADQEHLAALARVILDERAQAGHLMVDRDRQVREASRRALDCDAHGAQLRELEGQVDHFSRTAEQNDRARVALLGLAQELREISPDVMVKGSVLVSAAQKVLDAHQRAWR